MFKISFLENNKNLEDRTRALFLEQIEKGEVLVRSVGIKTIEKEAKEMIDAGVNAIIARGGTYNDLSKLGLNVPIINLVISDSDILLSLNYARKRYKKVVLLLHRNILFNPDDYIDLIGVELEIHRYTMIDELEYILDTIELDDDTIVVGSGAINELSKQKKINFINIFVQNFSLLQAYDQAIKVLDSMKMERQRSNLLDSILYYVNDGVIIIDLDGNILHVNRKAKEILMSSEIDEPKTIFALFKEYPLEIYKNLKIADYKDIITEVNSQTLAISTSMFMLDENNKRLIITMQDVTKIQKMEQNIRRMLVKKGLSAEYEFSDILTRDKKLKMVINQAKKISENDGSVLIYGDSGTGKELFAQSIHNESNRNNGPFVAVNCAAISESLLESELFGYVGGAFTGANKEGKAGLFELSHKGTILLDEINSMSLNLQAKILRVIEEGEVMRVGSDYVIPLDIRIIAASNRELIQEVKDGRFRHDLYFRLNTFELRIPTLNERKDDIIYLFKNFLSQHNYNDPNSITIPKEFEELLLNHNWWGNVRELRSVALRYHVYNGDNSNEQILKEDALEELNLINQDYTINLTELNKTVESLIINSLLEQNVSKTEIAKLLGISRQALYKKGF